MGFIIMIANKNNAIISMMIMQQIPGVFNKNVNKT